VVLPVLVVRPGAAAADELAALLAGLDPAPAGALAFEEARMSSLLAEPLALRGELTVGPDGVIDKRIPAPFAARLRVDGSSVAIERDGQVRRVPLAGDRRWQALHAGIVGLVGRDAALIRRSFAAEVDRTAAGWRLRLVPRGAPGRSPVRAIVATGVAGRLLTLRIDLGADEWQELRFAVPAP
jgi:hypothetical protein